MHVQSNPIVNVLITNNVTSLTSETRLNRDLTIGALKRKLELMTGATASDMHLEVFNREDKLVCTMTNDSAQLGSYPVDNGMRLHVIDKRGKSLELEDLSTVQKYEISDEDYAKKSDSVRAFKAKMKLGQFQDVDPNKKQQEEANKKKKEEEETQKASTMHVGDRCEMSVTAQPVKRGTVRYVGETGFKPGHWVGVECDEPLGKHDGCVEGKRYFQCQPKYGVFVRPSQVTVGNFPEFGLDDDDMEM